MLDVLSVGGTLRLCRFSRRPTPRELWASLRVEQNATLHTGRSESNPSRG
jgi:hypothetical protein